MKQLYSVVVEYYLKELIRGRVSQLFRFFESGEQRFACRGTSSYAILLPTTTRPRTLTLSANIKWFQATDDYTAPSIRPLQQPPTTPPPPSCRVRPPPSIPFHSIRRTPPTTPPLAASADRKHGQRSHSPRQRAVSRILHQPDRAHCRESDRTAWGNGDAGCGGGGADCAESGGFFLVIWWGGG